MNASEHFAWARKRALDFCRDGKPADAITSLVTDLGKHEGTAHILDRDMLRLAIDEVLCCGVEGARRFIVGLRGPARVVAGR